MQAAASKKKADLTGPLVRKRRWWFFYSLVAFIVFILTLLPLVARPSNAGLDSIYLFWIDLRQTEPSHFFAVYLRSICSGVYNTIADGNKATDPQHAITGDLDPDFQNCTSFSINPRYNLMVEVANILPGKAHRIAEIESEVTATFLYVVYVISVVLPPTISVLCLLKGYFVRKVSSSLAGGWLMAFLLVVNSACLLITALTINSITNNALLKLNRYGVSGANISASGGIVFPCLLWAAVLSMCLLCAHYLHNFINDVRSKRGGKPTTGAASGLPVAASAAAPLRPPLAK